MERHHKMVSSQRSHFTADDLAQEIRRIDGNHDLGAGQLAEKLFDYISDKQLSLESFSSIIEENKAMRKALTQIGVHGGDFTSSDGHARCRETAMAALAAVSELPTQPNGMDQIKQVLLPFAEIGAWILSRNVTDNTPLLDVEHDNGVRSICTREHFKAAHSTLQAILHDIEPAQPSNTEISKVITDYMNELEYGDKRYSIHKFGQDQSHELAKRINAVMNDRAKE